MKVLPLSHARVSHRKALVYGNNAHSLLSHLLMLKSFQYSFMGSPHQNYHHEKHSLHYSKCKPGSNHFNVWENNYRAINYWPLATANAHIHMSTSIKACNFSQTIENIFKPLTTIVRFLSIHFTLRILL